MLSRPWICPSVIALVAAFFINAPTQSEAAQRDGHLFEIDGFEKPGARAHFKKTRGIRMERATLLRPRMYINLFGENVRAVRDRVEHHEDGTISWIGHIAGNENDLVVLTGRKGAFAGRIDYDGRAFEITGMRTGQLTLNEIDPSVLPTEEPFFLPDALGDAGGGDSFAKSEPATASAAIEQDLLAAYTDDACRAVGGNGSTSCSQIEANIVNAVADMNASYQASGVNVTVNLVGMVQTDYNEGSKDISDMLSELRRTSDGQIDHLHDERNNYGADLLALITGSGGGFCGIAYVNASSSYAMSVTAEFCLGGRTLAHEIGHNQGVTHARSQEDGGVSGEYNYGYRRCNDGSVDDVGAPYFRTIMAYGCSGASRTGHFSNPNINYNGVPTGIDPTDDPGNAAWAARTINESAGRIAGFRAATTPPTNPPTPPAPIAPSAPSGLIASALSDSEVRLQWSDNADNEKKYIVRRALGDGDFQTIAFLPQNSIGFTDNGLDPDTLYRYRVRASNDAGRADSNVARVQTDRPTITFTDKAIREYAGAFGRVTGGRYNTLFDDGRYQRIYEVSTGGIRFPNSRRGEHHWVFDVHGGDTVIFEVNAFITGREGFAFWYKRANDSIWRKMLVVNTGSKRNVQRFHLPEDTQGRVLIRARDSFLGKHDPADMLGIDYMAIFSSQTVTSTNEVAITPLPLPPVLIEEQPGSNRWRPYGVLASGLRE